MSNSLADDLARMVSAARTAIGNAPDERVLDEVRVQYLGKKGELTALLKTLGSLAPDARPAAGAEINVAKDAVQAELTVRRDALAEAELQHALAAERLD
ncbi:MAG: phenylalanine--tRNA ligase subunit alpha, partial [Gammaproteobacteria bacterium]